MLAGDGGFGPPSRVDLIAVPGDWVIGKDPPCFKSLVGHEGLRQFFRTSNESTEEIDFRGDAPGVVLRPE